MTKLIAAIAAALFIILTTSLTAGAQAPAPKPAEKPAQECVAPSHFEEFTGIRKGSGLYKVWYNARSDHDWPCFRKLNAVLNGIEDTEEGWKKVFKSGGSVKIYMRPETAARFKTLEDQVATLGAKIVSLENSNLRLTAQNAQLKSAVGDLKARADERIIHLEDELDQAADVIAQKDEQIVGLEQKLAATATQGATWKAQAEQEIIRLTEERDDLTKQTVRLAVELADAKYELKEEQKLREFSSAVNEVGKLAKSVTGFASELRALSEKLNPPVAPVPPSSAPPASN